MSRESVTWDGITVYFTLNREKQINLRVPLLVKFKDASGQEVTVEVKPLKYKGPRGRHYTTLVDQINFIKKEIQHAYDTQHRHS